MICLRFDISSRCKVLIVKNKPGHIPSFLFSAPLLNEWETHILLIELNGSNRQLHTIISEWYFGC